MGNLVLNFFKVLGKFVIGAVVRWIYVANITQIGHSMLRSTDSSEYLNWACSTQPVIYSIPGIILWSNCLPISNSITMKQTTTTISFFLTLLCELVHGTPLTPQKNYPVPAIPIDVFKAQSPKDIGPAVVCGNTGWACSYMETCCYCVFPPVCCGYPMQYCDKAGTKCCAYTFRCGGGC
ncbi:hypothetical protein BGX38DRAFT_438051 [Terfezia claveryi]|nr:hypothetical protein BGX38DRAFT_438051 [Terfezia claveryi]